MSSSAWEEFRGLLRAALEVDMDDEYLLFDLIYQIVEPDRPQHRTTVSFYPEARATLMKTHFKPLLEKRCRIQGAGEPQEIYDGVIKEFRRFPRQEDPEAWQCFDSLVREMAGLVVDAHDSDLFDTFLDYPVDE